MMTPRSVSVASSPGREKLPAPPGLARLLIRKTRSRSVARASPMFGARSRSVGPTGRSNENQGEEPSSPKVTCIGQVRIKTGVKGKKKKRGKSKSKSKQVKCKCFNSALFCGAGFEGKKKKSKKKKRDWRVGCSLWPCWARACCATKSDHHDGSKASGVKIQEAGRVVQMSRNSNFSEEPGRFSNFNEEQLSRFSNFSDEPARSSNYARRSFMGRDELSDQEEGEEGQEEKEEINGQSGEEKELVSSATTTPPKNALFLMRCRSAPQHHNRFAPSPNIAIEETTETKPKEESEPIVTTEREKTEETTAPIERETLNLNEEKEEETEEEEEEEEEMRCNSARPLVLTRCKSEPASQGEKLVGQAGQDTSSTSCFWAHTGSGSRQKKMGLSSNGLELRSSSPMPTH